MLLRPPKAAAPAVLIRPLPGVWAVGVTGRHEPGGVGDEGKLCGGICQQQGIINEDVGLLANGEGMLWEVRPTGGHI